MMVKKPSIFIYTASPDAAVLKEVCAGIEEEGVFYELTETNLDGLSELAWHAANDSMLGSGIGVKGTAVELQMRGMQKGKPIESYDSPSKEQCRKLGANSARAIKKMSFK